MNTYFSSGIISSEQYKLSQKTHNKKVRDFLELIISQEALMCDKAMTGKECGGCLDDTEWCADCLQTGVCDRPVVQIGEETGGFTVNTESPAYNASAYKLADTVIRNRIERLSDKILTIIDTASTEDDMTVAEIVGCLEMCKASVIEKAFC